MPQQFRTVLNNDRLSACLGCIVKWQKAAPNFPSLRRWVSLHCCLHTLLPGTAVFSYHLTKRWGFETCAWRSRRSAAGCSLLQPLPAFGRCSACWAFCCHRLPPGGRAAPCSAPIKPQRPFSSLAGSFPCYYPSPFLLIPQVLQEWRKDAVCEYCTESKQSNFHEL